MNHTDNQLLEEALSKVYIKEQSADGLAAAFEAWFIENFPPERLKEKKMLWFAFQEGSKHHSSGNRHIDEPI
jgi:hypothetical protein